MSLNAGELHYSNEYIGLVETSNMSTNAKRIIVIISGITLIVFLMMGSEKSRELDKALMRIDAEWKMATDDYCACDASDFSYCMDEMDHKTEILLDKMQRLQVKYAGTYVPKARELKNGLAKLQKKFEKCTAEHVRILKSRISN